ncbi:hypothetical protein D3C85_1750770 [compost metagenome]
MGLPEARLGQHPVDAGQGLLQAAQQGLQEPFEPGADVESASLAGFEDAVIAGAVVEDAGRHGVEADGLMLALGQG